MRDPDRRAQVAELRELREGIAQLMEASAECMVELLTRSGGIKQVPTARRTAGVSRSYPTGNRPVAAR
jgi:hypothetical protein